MEFLRKLTARPARGEARYLRCARGAEGGGDHEGPSSATWQLRCRVHFMRNALAHAGKSGRRVVSAFVATAFARTTPAPPDSSGAASPTNSRPKLSKLAALMDEAEPDVLAYMGFPVQHRTKLRSTDVFDKGLSVSVLSSFRAGDLVASGVSAESAMGGHGDLAEWRRPRTGGVSGRQRAFTAALALAAGNARFRAPRSIYRRVDPWVDAAARPPRTARSPSRPVRRSARRSRRALTL
ncbi:MAG: transposase [Amaricoccus sp.]